MSSSRSRSQTLESIPDRLRSTTFTVNTRRSTILLVCVIAALSYLVPETEGALMRNFGTAWPLWPTNAILVAALMLVPTRIWALLMAASFGGFALYDLQAGVPLTSIAWFIPADTIQVLTAAIG